MPNSRPSAVPVPVPPSFPQLLKLPRLPPGCATPPDEIVSFRGTVRTVELITNRKN
jgi:hypothetical protein